MGRRNKVMGGAWGGGTRGWEEHGHGEEFINGKVVNTGN